LWGWRCGRKSSKRGFKDGDKISLFAHRDSSANILFKGVNKKKLQEGNLKKKLQKGNAKLAYFAGG
jgi:hypothetical protein